MDNMYFIRQTNEVFFSFTMSICVAMVICRNQIFDMLYLYLLTFLLVNWCS
jgi:hypothetical protein